MASSIQHPASSIQLANCLVRLEGFPSNRAGLQAVMHDITALLAMVRRQPQPDAC